MSYDMLVLHITTLKGCYFKIAKYFERTFPVVQQQPNKSQSG